MDHLEELRMRIIAVVVVLTLAIAVCWWRVAWLFDVLAAPLDDRWPIQTFGVTEPFFITLSVAAQAGLVLTTPVIAWNAWRFVAPAIPPGARRSVGWLLVAAPALFTAGVAFGYVFVLGPAVQFLLGLGPSSITVVVRANDYYSFVTTTLLAMGAVFCFPLAVLGVARVGLISSAWLRSNRRTAIVLMVVLAALLPTADPVSLVIEVLPLLVLFELSVVAVRVQERVLAKAAAQRAAEAGNGSTTAGA